MFYVFFPLFIWLGAFLIWFYWYDLTRLFGREAQKSKAAAKTSRKLDMSEKTDALPAKPPQEKILEEDRKKLEDILKRRQ